MDILKANHTDERLPERLREQMKLWGYRDLNRVLQIRLVALVQLDVIKRGNETAFFLFLKEHKILHLLEV